MTKDLQVQRVEIEVSYPLTDSMVEHRGVRIAQLLSTREEAEAKAKAEAKAAKKSLDEIQEEIDKLAAEIRTKSFLTKVEAERRPNFENNTWTTVRIDTEGLGLVVAEEAMTANERQLAINVDAEPGPREPAKVVKITRKKKGAEPVEDEAPAPH